MTARLDLHTAAPRVVWARVSSDLSVASAGGDFVGSVERTTVGFVAVDGRGEPAGLFSDERAARRALTTDTGSRLVRKRTRLQRAQFVAATGAGAIATTLALTAGALAPLI